MERFTSQQSTGHFITFMCHVVQFIGLYMPYTVKSKQILH